MAPLKIRSNSKFAATALVNTPGFLSRLSPIPGPSLAPIAQQSPTAPCLDRRQLFVASVTPKHFLKFTWRSFLHGGCHVKVRARAVAGSKELPDCRRSTEIHLTAVMQCL